MSNIEGRDLSRGGIDKALIDAVDETLSILGSHPRDTIFQNFETIFQMKREEIPLNLTTFKRNLKLIFGSGSGNLERIMTRRLCEKLGLDTGKLESNDLAVCVDIAKKCLVSDGKNDEQKHKDTSC